MPADCSYTVTKGVAADAAARILARPGASIVVGPRGSGKTTLMQSTIPELEDQAFERTSPDSARDILYVSPRRIPHVRDDIPRVQVIRPDEGTGLLDLAMHKRLDDEQWAAILIDDADLFYSSNSRRASELCKAIALFQRLRVPVVLAFQRLPKQIDSTDSFGKTDANCVVTTCPTTLGVVSAWTPS